MAALAVGIRALPARVCWHSHPCHRHLATCCRLSWVAQLVLLATLLPHLRDVCAGPLLSHPVMQRRTHSLHTLLSHAGTPLPLIREIEGAPEDECAVTLSFLQITLGALLPLLLDTLAAARLHHEHERQRRAASIPLERGLVPAAYRVVHSLLLSDGSLPVPLLAVGLVAATWDLASLLLHSGATLRAAA